MTAMSRVWLVAGRVCRWLWFFVVFFFYKCITTCPIIGFISH